MVFILAYLFFANRDFLGLAPRPGRARHRRLPALCRDDGAAVPRVPGLGSSAGYAPVPVLILLYAWLLRHRAPRHRARLAAGAGLLVVSLTLRTIDLPLCPRWPRGTHVFWHLLNAVLLAWMIEVWRRHRLEGGGPPALNARERPERTADGHRHRDRPRIAKLARIQVEDADLPALARTSPRSSASSSN